MNPTGNYGRSAPTLAEYVDNQGMPNGAGYVGVVSDYDLAVHEPGLDVEWTTSVDTEEDSDVDGMDVSMTVEAYAHLVFKGRAHCPGCAGGCGR